MFFAGYARGMVVRILDIAFFPDVYGGDYFFIQSDDNAFALDNVARMFLLYAYRCIWPDVQAFQLMKQLVICAVSIGYLSALANFQFR